MNRREIISKAKEFCKENEVSEYPVPIIGLCNKQGLKVYEEYLPEDVSGFIVVQNDNFAHYNTGRLIVANLLDSPKRRRFTIAHELAHYILHKGSDNTLYAHRDAGQRGEIETEANIFASYILMPDNLLEDALKTLGNAKALPPFILVEIISNEFAVSLEAAQIRLQQHGVI